MSRRTRFEPREEAWMQRAIELARRGLLGVSPNPMVGAVVVRGGKVIGEGFHRRYGGPHAEVEALRSAGGARGADVYVTLEPCGHEGKTPPCALALLEAGVGRVVFGASDPNPLTAGRGPHILRQSGVAVAAGCLEEECRDLNAPYFHWRQKGLPWVILKWAMTLDGKAATEAGESRWITGEVARARAHALRRRVDAVLVGTETALRDDPLLDPRPPRGRTPARVVLDRRGRLPLGLRLLAADPREAGKGPRIYVTSAAVARRREKVLASRGVRVLILPRGRGPEGALEPLLKALGALGISQVLVEGGPRLLGSFLAQGLAEEVAAFIAPRLLGGRTARSAIEGPGLGSLRLTRWLADPHVARLGEDLLVSGRLLPRGGSRAVEGPSMDRRGTVDGR
jgi:diaminohydroxyphosphoribosylaminopyrimidine deaminase/5-amino-6-(5-phosphoribosylamino)uracil reductase